MEFEEKSDEFKYILQSLPEVNKVVLKMICEHLGIELKTSFCYLLFLSVKVAANDGVNKMSAQNISVCFGPAFMWAKQETIGMNLRDLQKLWRLNQGLSLNKSSSGIAGCQISMHSCRAADRKARFFLSNIRRNQTSQSDNSEEQLFAFKSHNIQVRF